MTYRLLLVKYNLCEFTTESYKDYICLQASKPGNDDLLIFNEQTFNTQSLIQPKLLDIPTQTQSDYERWIELDVLYESTYTYKSLSDLHL